MQNVSRGTKELKNSKTTGSLGEKVAAEFLMKHGFSIIMRNYWRKWGEIDLIAQKEGVIHFVEVKSVSYETISDLQTAITTQTWRPEELVHHFKMHQMEKAIETWINENSYEGEWCIDVAAVRIVPRETFATVNYIENINM